MNTPQVIPLGKRLLQVHLLLLWFIVTLVVFIAIFPSGSKIIVSVIPFLYLCIAIRLGANTYWKTSNDTPWPLKGDEWSVMWRAFLLWIWIEIVMSGATAFHLPDWTDFCVYLMCVLMAFLEAAHRGELLAKKMPKGN